MSTRVLIYGRKAPAPTLRRLRRSPQHDAAMSWPRDRQLCPRHPPPGLIIDAREFQTVGQRSTLHSTASRGPSAVKARSAAPLGVTVYSHPGQSDQLNLESLA